MTNHQETRPEVLNRASETQIEELERQFEESDKEAWNALTSSYGWSRAESNAVWEWFGQDPEKAAN